MSTLGQQRSVQQSAPQVQAGVDQAPGAEEVRAQLIQNDPRYRALAEALGEFREDTLRTACDRKNGARSNVEQSTKAVEDAGFWLSVSGGKAALIREQQADIGMYQGYKQKEEQLQRIALGADSSKESFLNLEIQGRLQNAQADALAAVGKTSESQQMRQLAQQSFNEAHKSFLGAMASLQTSSAVDTRAYMKELKGVNEDLAWTDKKLLITEVGLVAAPAVVAVAGATIAATGLAAGTMAVGMGVGTITSEMGVVGATAVGVLGGTAVGTLGLAPGHLVEAVGHIAYGNKSGSEAFHNAGSQVVHDIRMTGTASIAAVTGLGATQMLGQGASILSQGVVSGGAQAATNGTLNLGIDLATGSAPLDSRAPLGLLEETGIGLLTGGMGSKFGEARRAISSTVGRAGLVSSEVLTKVGVGVGSANLRGAIEGRAVTAEDYARDFISTAMGTAM
jgi:predicted secreted protein